jgi:hypothetical protein
VVAAGNYCIDRLFSEAGWRIGDGRLDERLEIQA